MTTLNTEHSEVILHNPVDIVEELAAANDWAYERQGDDELTLFISAQYTDLQMRIYWRDDFKTLQFACIFDLKVPPVRQRDVYQTIGRINERLWIGHFEFWAEEEALLYRHASLANDPLIGAIGEEHIATIIETAVGECDRFYPVFQFVMWGGQTPDQAIESAMLECAGTA
ncbi:MULTISPECIES: YbjN domain-containing protein [Kordiimonadales]|uniref:YbjN domain-containing protein n=1 Tax=Gimibacter soli TaxID=3024400 RepID=A0AAE9XTW3_9PROT|nr:MULTISPECIES: YbjN domain-containing protein [Kordiimonadales]WCL55180.1 YbjN domain-containing protein [Gimibacter soli]